MLELETIPQGPLEKNQIMLDNIIRSNENAEDNVNNKMLELMEDNNGENTTVIEESLESQKKEQEKVKEDENKEKEADEALVKETSEEA